MHDIKFLFFIFIVSLGLNCAALNFATYDSLSQALISYAKGPKPNLVALMPLKTKLEGLKRSDEDLYQQLNKIISADNGHLKLQDLAKVLEAMRNKFHIGKLDEAMKTKLVDFFSDLINGKKELKNIVVIGRTRGGKSTFISTMIDPLNKELHASVSDSALFSHTVNPKPYFQVFDSLDNGLYAARIIDTPGLSEVKSMDSPEAKRSDEHLVDLIAKNLKDLTIHRVLQIFPLSSSGYDPANREAFKLIKTTFADKNIFTGKIDLVFPRVDEISVNNLERLIVELKTILAMEGIKEIGKTYLSGTIFNYNFEEGGLKNVSRAAKNVFFYRNKLLHDIFDVPFSEYMVGNNISPETNEEITKIISQKAQEENENF
jgi:GTP-binding protein EngB required for normal cell division